MRISTSGFYQQASSTISSLYSELAKTHLEIATGKKVGLAQSDPLSVSQTIGFDHTKSMAAQYQRNAQSANNTMQFSDVALSASVDIVQRIQELAVSGLSDTHNPADRKAIAIEIRALNSALVDLANSKDSNGEYLFSGTDSFTRPFNPELTGDYNYQGNEGLRQLQVNDNTTVITKEHGQDVFVSNHDTLGQNSLFDTVSKLADDLDNNTVGSRSVNGDVLGNLTRALDGIVSAQSRIGARQNSLDFHSELNAARETLASEKLAAIEDVDLAAAIAKMAQQTAAVQAAQQSFAKMQQLSLFNYL